MADQDNMRYLFAILILSGLMNLFLFLKLRAEKKLSREVMKEFFGLIAKTKKTFNSLKQGF
jgi:hypothetical protein